MCTFVTVISYRFLQILLCNSLTDMMAKNILSRTVKINLVTVKKDKVSPSVSFHSSFMEHLHTQIHRSMQCFQLSVRPPRTISFYFFT